MNQNIIWKVVGGVILAVLLFAGGTWSERLLGDREMDRRLVSVEDQVESLVARVRAVEARADVQDERYTFIINHLERIQDSLNK